MIPPPIPDSLEHLDGSISMLVSSVWSESGQVELEKYAFGSSSPGGIGSGAIYQYNIVLVHHREARSSVRRKITQRVFSNPIQKAGMKTYVSTGDIDQRTTQLCRVRAEHGNSQRPRL